MEKIISKNNLERNDLNRQEILCENLVDFFVHKSNSITNKKIQKIVYYVYALNYALNNDEKKHFKNIKLDFEAWVHGPVNELLYNKLRDFVSEPISANNFTNVKEKYFSNDEKTYLSDIWDLFGDFSAIQLEILTHREKPWLEQRVGLGELSSSKNIISPKTMKEFYREKYNLD